MNNLSYMESLKKEVYEKIITNNFVTINTKTENYFIRMIYEDEPKICCQKMSNNNLLISMSIDDVFNFIWKDSFYWETMFYMTTFVDKK